MQTLAEGSQARADAEAEYQQSIKSSAEKFEETEKYLSKIIDNEKNTLKIAEKNTSEQFGVARGFERVSQGISSLQEGIKGLSFGLIDLTGETGKLGEFFKGLQNTLTGVISIGAGLAEMIGGIALLGFAFGGAKNEGEGLQKGFKTIKENLSKFNPVQMLGDSFKKGASTFDGFMDGVFGKKVVDKAGKLQNKSKGGGFSFAKKEDNQPGTMEGVSAGAELRERLGKFTESFGDALNPKNFGKGIKKISLGFTKGLKGAFASFGKAFTMLATAGKAFLAGAATLLTTALSFAASALIGLGSMLLAAAPFILLGIAAAALIKVVYEALKMFDEKFPEFFDSIQWFFGKVYDFGKLVVGSIFNGVSAAFDSIMELFKFDESAGLLGLGKTLIDIVTFPVNAAINFVMGLFGWNDPDEPFTLTSFIYDTGVAIGEWFTENFSFEIPKFNFSIADTFNQMLDDMGAWLDENLSWEKISSGLNPLNWFGGDDEEEPQGMFRGGSVQGGETYLVGEKGPEIFTPSVNGTIIPNHEIGTGSRLRGMNNEVQDGQRSGGGNQLVQTVMSSEQNANNTYNMQSSSKRTANSDPTLFKTAMVVPL